jgi:hypothetical protein
VKPPFLLARVATVPHVIKVEVTFERCTKIQPIHFQYLVNLTKPGGDFMLVNVDSRIPNDPEHTCDPSHTCKDAFSSRFIRYALLDVSALAETASLESERVISGKFLNMKALYMSAIYPTVVDSYDKVNLDKGKGITLVKRKRKPSTFSVRRRVDPRSKS